MILRCRLLALASLGIVMAPGCKSREFSDSRSSATFDPAEGAKVTADRAIPLSKHERKIPDEDKEIARSVSLAVAKAVKEKKDGVTRRDAHPKHHGCLKGEFAVMDDVPAAAKHGLFAANAKYPVWARFSNAGIVAGNRDDRIPDARGVAIKLMGVPGPKTLPGDENSKNVDFLFVNVPFFFADDLKEYNDQLEDPRKIASRLDKLLKVAANGISDPLVEPYFSITPFALGDTAVKYKVTACKGQRAERTFLPGPNYLRENLKKHLDSATGTEGCFDFGVQFYEDDGSTPVEKGAATWNEREAPFVSIARLTFPKQDFSDPKRDAFCESVSFNPSRVLVGQHALGNLNRGRREVYKAVAARRNTDNKVTAPEPDGTEP